MTRVYIQAIILMVVAILILILAGCSTKTEKQLNQIGREIEQVQVLLKNLDQPAMRINEAIQQNQILKELIKTNKLLKKEFGKGSDFWCQMIGPGMSVCKKYDSSIPPTEKKTLNQNDIDRNKNNRLQ